MRTMSFQGNRVSLALACALVLCAYCLADSASASSLAQGADVPSLQSPQESASSVSKKPEPGIALWLFVAALCVFALGIFVWVFREISSLFKPGRSRTSAFKRRVDKRYQERHDNQTSLQEAVDDDN